ncbi:helix-turn-helix domain-containing protein [Anaeromicropila populeti]|uniref:Transcriptional regulator, XRE family with cupin sensor n=1 Tax=Anaeromicropila populeti TaxID=37658 RepID=A0A1I6KH41_9FIRM|nr:XRE family transcriptional regulator [Anaeromicropila populeti]SFR90547.1 transcriptional regulator, XRE family with cupin sensor [Anaeromicropila populeti]
MDILNQNVALNLKRIRKAKNMSLDDVAEQTGISKSMLGQIEREQSNPTVAVLGKIVSGLRVDFMDLLNPPPHETYIIKGDGFSPSRELKNQYKVYSYFPYENDRNFEIYKIVIYPSGQYETEAHGEQTFEYLIINEGELTLKVSDDELHILKQGDGIRFRTDRPHSYTNNGTEVLSFDIVFTWDKKGV